MGLAGEGGGVPGLRSCACPLESFGLRPPTRPWLLLPCSQTNWASPSVLPQVPRRQAVSAAVAEEAADREAAGAE